MSREVPYDPDLICDICGSKGGFDFMGDCLCTKCADGEDDMSDIYSQGVASDGPVILCDGLPITPDMIVEVLNRYVNKLTAIGKLVDELIEDFSDWEYDDFFTEIDVINAFKEIKGLL